MSFFQSLGIHGNARATRTFKPKPQASTQAHMLRQYAQATLGSGSLKQAVMLPEGEDSNEWIAVHVVDFFNQINMLYGTITEFCSPKSCPRMKATEEYEYLWQDSTNPKYKKPVKVSAPEYIECLMNWVQRYFESEQYFPTKIGVPFHKNSTLVFKNILKRLFRVYAHIYCHHFDQITELGLQAHLNTSLKHFVLFCNEFKLVDQKEYGPLKELIEIMLEDD
ncbi:DBF2 kinase activator protein Mob1p [Trichomonascus vanleenenianus]|uniref:Mob1p n=1 Tax=Trichomonascus vanleenenianus TaxID=2268995 RepID=UPI003ECA3A3F